MINPWNDYEFWSRVAMFLIAYWLGGRAMKKRIVAALGSYLEKGTDELKRDIEHEVEVNKTKEIIDTIMFIFIGGLGGAVVLLSLIKWLAEN